MISKYNCRTCFLDNQKKAPKEVYKGLEPNYFVLRKEEKLLITENTCSHTTLYYINIYKTSQYSNQNFH